RGEPRATCSHCAMVQRFDEPLLELAFDSRVKCCSYVPDVHNFNVGRALADTDPVGADARGVLRSRMKERAGVSPLGLAVPLLYRTIYENAPAAFGRAPALRCPYYVDKGGLCGIWRHRDSVCSTWFCKFESGALGKKYWRIVQGLLALIETSVKLWVLAEVGLDEGARADLWSRTEFEKRGKRPQLDEPTMTATVDFARYKQDWANFYGREEEFFLRCAEAVNPLTSEDILRIGGAVVAAAIDATKHAIKTIAELKIPERVKPGNGVYLQLRRGGVLRVRAQGRPTG